MVCDLIVVTEKMVSVRLEPLSVREVTLIADEENTGTRQLPIGSTKDYGYFTSEAGSIIKVRTSKSSIFVGDTLYLRAQWKKENV